jgi:sec-independent protein translocase protein TatA
MFGKIGAPELAIILVIVLLVFGPGKLPQAASSFGKALRAFREGQKSEPENERTKKTGLRKQPRKLASKTPLKSAGGAQRQPANRTIGTEALVPVTGETEKEEAAIHAS